jgi:hypothetical protein
MGDVYLSKRCRKMSCLSYLLYLYLHLLHSYSHHLLLATSVPLPVTYTGMSAPKNECENIL